VNTLSAPPPRRAAATIPSLPTRVRAAILSIGVGVVCWEVLSRTLQFPFQPSLAAVLQATWRMTVSGEIPNGLRASIGVLALGYGAAALIGVPAGLMLGRYRVLAFALDPYLDALLAVPSLLLVPVFFGVFGLGRETQIAVVFLYSFVVIVTMTRSGLATLDPVHAEMARAFGASERQILRQVLLPGTLPTIMAGLRLGIGRAVRALINAEMLVGPLGLGALLRQYGSRFDAASLYGILAVLVTLALLAHYVMELADRRLNGWTNA
jgi:NitT/TauT family transport system permease protein